MNDNKFDHFIPEASKILTNVFLNYLSSSPEFKQDIDTAPLLNMTVAVFIGSLVNILDKIKECTEGEDKLINNIELTKNSLIKAIGDLPFVSKTEFMNY